MTNASMNDDDGGGGGGGGKGSDSAHRLSRVVYFVLQHFSPMIKSDGVASI